MSQSNKRKADEELDQQRFYDEDSASPLAGRQIARPSKKLRNNNIAGRPLELTRLLETLDADSLRNVLQIICDRHPQIGQEVVTSAPRPSVASALGVLKQYQERFEQSFPFGSNRAGDYAYDRVAAQLKQLTTAISDFVPHYLPPNENQASASLEFLDQVTHIIRQIPDWDSASNRYHKDNAYEEISRAWALVISEASKRGGGFQLHNGGWDNKVQEHNRASGGRMEAAVQALGSNLSWMGGSAAQDPNNDPNSIRNQLFSGTYGMNLSPRVGQW